MIGAANSSETLGQICQILRQNVVKVNYPVTKRAALLPALSHVQPIRSVNRCVKKPFNIFLSSKSVLINGTFPSGGSTYEQSSRSSPLKLVTIKNSRRKEK
jgi:hypothetical protein